ncbi:MAG: hypothetical protein FE834_05395 [Gammaproteobacteria bacterium]|nr:hypothetical protein [Gammaproteobacteria bacterium]
MINKNKIDNSEDISETQLSELDTLLQSFNNVNDCKNTKINGDDSVMVQSVEDASAYFNGENQPFLDGIVHIDSSYAPN